MLGEKVIVFWLKSANSGDIMKYIKSFLISLFFQLFLFFALGKAGWHCFKNIQFNNPDSYYTMDLFYQHQVNHAILGSNPMILGSHLSWIHWSSFYLYLINGLSLLLENVFSIERSIEVASALLTFVPSTVLGFVFSLFMLSYVRSYLIIFVFEFILFVNEYIMGYANILSLTHHMLMICISGLFLFSVLMKEAKYYISGILATLSLWVSPEVFPLVLSGLGIYAFRYHNISKVACIWFVSSLFIVLCDPNPPTMPWYAPDRLDLCYVILAGLIMSSTFFFRNEIILLLSLSFSTALWMFIIPHLHEGVHGFIPVSVYQEWYRHVSEILPSQINILFFEKLFTPACIYLTALYVSIRKENLLFLYLCLITGIYFCMGIFHYRSMLEFELVNTIFSFYILSHTQLFQNSMKNLIICVVGVSLSINSLYFTKTFINYQCDNTQQLEDFFKKHQTSHILNIIDESPKILWVLKEDHVKTFAGPYHRDSESINNEFRIFRTYPESPTYKEDMRLLDKYHIDYIVLKKDETTTFEYFQWKHFNYFMGLLNSNKKIPHNIKYVGYFGNYKIYQVLHPTMNVD